MNTQQLRLLQIAGRYTRSSAEVRHRAHETLVWFVTASWEICFGLVNLTLNAGILRKETSLNDKSDVVKQNHF